MAAPTTTHSVTVRKLSSTITSLWAKIKSTFQTLGNLVTAWGSTPSDSKYPSEKLVKDSLDAKVSSIKKNGSTITLSSGVADIGYMPVTEGQSSATVQNLIQALRVKPGGRMGSSYVNSSTVGSTPIPGAWYNYIWIPHQNGSATSDNQSYGTLILTPMATAPDVYVIEGSSLNTSSATYRIKRLGNDASFLYANLAWGGAFRSTLSPFDNYAFKSANCFFGAKPSAIRVEYSTDGGTTWTDYGLTSEQKQAIFNQYAGLTVFCGKNTHIQPGYTGSIVGTKDLSNDNIADQRLRITICESSLANEGGTGSTDRWLYCNLRRIGIYCTTNSSGQGGLHCVFEKRTRGNFKSATDSWVTVGDFNIQGDSGWNSLPCDNGYSADGSIRLGAYSDSFYSEVRFTVWANKLNASPAASQTGNPGINKIVAYSELLWTNGSSNANVANFGAPYTINASSGNTHFSKGITSGVAIPISSGGTGKTSVTAGNYLVGNGTNALTEKTPNAAANDLINALTTGESTPTDNDYYVAQYAGGGTTTKTFHRRPVKALWEYIKGKISSVLGLTAADYGGNAATATTAAGYTSGGAIDTALQGKVTNVAYDSTNKKLTETINGTTTDVVSVATLKTDLSLAKGDVGLGNVDNTSDATKKTNFTGSVAASDYGFPTGDAVYRAIEDRAHDVVYISTSTTASQVSSYLNDNKYPVLLTPISSGSSIFARLPLVSVVSGTSAKYIFSAISGATRYSMTLDATDGWGALSSASVENTANKVTSFQSTPDDSHYPSEKLTKDSLDNKAPKDDGLTTHDTTKFYRADGSWATPPTGSVSPAGSAGVPVYIDSSGNPVACTMMGSQNGSLLGKMFSTSSQSADTLFFCMLTQNWVNGRYLSIDNAKKMLNGVFAFSTSSNKVYTLYSDSATANLPDGALISITNRGASGTTVTVKRTSSSSTTVGVGTTKLFNKSNGSWYAIVVS